MPFDKDKFVSDFTASGMEEAQAELLATKQAGLVSQLPSKQDLAALRSSFEAEQAGLRREIDTKIVEAASAVRREVSEQIQKTRLLIDDVQTDIRKSEARLEGLMKSGFTAMDYRFNVLAVSNMLVIVFVMAFMAFLFRG